MTAFADSFNRANETPIASPWVRNPGGDPTSQINLTSNALTKTSSGDVAIYYAGAATGDAQYSEAKQNSKPVENDWGPAVRVQTGVQLTCYFSQYYEPGGGGQDKNIDKLINDVFTRIVGDTTGSLSANSDIQRLEVSGSSLTSYHNGVVKNTTTDTSIPTGGQPGIFIYNTGGAIDDWVGGDIGSTPGSAAPQQPIIRPLLIRLNRILARFRAPLIARPVWVPPDAGVSTVTFDAVVDGNAAVTADNSVTRGFAAGVAGAATVSAADAVNRDLAANVTGAAAVAAANSVTRSFSTAVAGAGAVSADLSFVKVFAATVAGAGAVVADLAVQRGFSTSVAGAAAVTADMAVSRSFSAGVTGAAAVTAGNAVTRTFAAAPAGAAAVTAANQVTRSFSTTVAGAAVVNGDVTVTGGSVSVFSATITGAAAVTGAASVTRGLAGTVAGASALAGANSVTRRFSAGVTGAAVVQAAWVLPRVLYLTFTVCDSLVLTSNPCDTLAFTVAAVDALPLTVGGTDTMAATAGTTDTLVLTAADPEEH